MAFTLQALFTHSRNRDGSFDSFCLKCFVTVAHCKSEPELAGFDKRHACEINPLSQRGNFPSQPTK
jgi:hypothetical protein